MSQVYKFMPSLHKKSILDKRGHTLHENLQLYDIMHHV